VGVPNPTKMVSSKLKKETDREIVQKCGRY
jgi:hypothetical protein